jgi:hypothetical protein
MEVRLLAESNPEESGQTLENGSSAQAILVYQWKRAGTSRHSRLPLAGSCRKGKES